MKKLTDIRPKTKVASGKSMCFALESRLLFDGAVVAVAAEVMANEADNQGISSEVVRDGNSSFFADAALIMAANAEPLTVNAMATKSPVKVAEPTAIGAAVDNGAFTATYTENADGINLYTANGGGIPFGATSGTIQGFELGGPGAQLTTDFAPGVTNLAFSIADLDSKEVISIAAYDKNGALIDDITPYIVRTNPIQTVTSGTAADSAIVSSGLKTTGVDNRQTFSPDAHVDFYLKGVEVSRVVTRTISIDNGTAELYFMTAEPPVAESGSTNTPSDANVTVKLTGTDVDGTIETVKVTTLPSPDQGVLYLADGITPVLVGAELSAADAAGLMFDPAPGFKGIVNIPFTVIDNDGIASAPASFVVDVADLNKDPVATPATFSGTEDKPVPVSLTGTDAEGPIKSVTIVSLPVESQGVLTKADGTPVVAGVPLTPTEAAALKFVPALNFNGAVTIPFTVTDSEGQVSSPPADLNINITGENDPPVASPVQYTASEDTPVAVKLAGTDVDGTVRKVTVTRLPSTDQGVLYLADGITPVTAGTALTPSQAAGLIFKPAPNFNGRVDIPFTVTDDKSAVSKSANASVTITPANDPPVGINGSTNTPQATATKIGLAGTDVDGTVASVTVTALPSPNQGILYLPDGIAPVVAGAILTQGEANDLVFKPAPGFSGLVTIPFVVTDYSGATSKSAAFVIDVGAVNEDPVATPTIVDGVQNKPVSVSLTGNDAEGPIKSVTVVSLPPTSQGILTKASGEPVVAGMPITPVEAASLLFVPAPGFTGAVTIPFTVADSVGQVSSPPVDLQIYINSPGTSNNNNIGALIMLANPTPPLFNPASGDAYALLPVAMPGIARVGNQVYQPARLSLNGLVHDYEVYLTGSLRDQVVLERQRYSFSIPAGAFRHANPSEQLQYEATLVNGSPLPGWLHFNDKQLNFTGVPPKGAKTTDVLVKAYDRYGNEAYATFKVTVNHERNYNHKENAAFKRHTAYSLPNMGMAMMEGGVTNDLPAVGKSGLSSQLSVAGRLSRLVESKALLDSLGRI